MQSPVECFFHLAFGKKFRMSHFNAVGKVPGQAIKEWPERGQIARTKGGGKLQPVLADTVCQWRHSAKKLFG